MQKKIKLSAVLSVLLIISMTFSSCGAFYSSHKVKLPYAQSADSLTEITPSKPHAPKVPEKMDFAISDTFDPKKSLEDFHNYNYNFTYLTVATSSENNSLFTNTQLYLDSSIYERNRVLEEKFSFKFTTLTNKASSLAQSISNAQKNNTAYTDLIAVSLADLTSFEGKNLLCDLSSLPFIGTSDDHAVNNETFSLESDIFIANEASILPSQTKVIFVNTALIDELGADSPYTLLSSKKWTWDALAGYLALGGKLAAADDIAKIIEATVKTDSEENPEKVMALAETLNASAVKNNAKDSFLSGESLFYLGTFADILELTSQETAYGLLPIPLFEEGDEYSDVHDAKNITVFACPKSASDIERSAFILTAIAAASKGSRANAFSQILDNKLLRDNGSRLALGYIFTAEIEVIH